MLSPITCFNCRGRLLHFENPVVMGILNVTPDSFFADSRLQNIDNAVSTAATMIEEGATILDIGGLSTRPGAELITEEEETRRVVPVIENVKKFYPDTFISIDSFRASVVKQAFDAGADIVNDVSGGQFDESLFKVLAEIKIPYILMHNGKSFDTMHQKPGLGDAVTTVFDYFTQKISVLNQSGVFDIFLDPGFGFGKQMDENYSLLKNLDFFNILNLPVLAGVSRKRMIYSNLGISADDALNGTTALNMYALAKGAKVLRVHDVREAVQTVELFKLIRNSDKDYYEN